MSLSGFLARVHVDRFGDLRMVIGDSEVNIDVVSVGDDRTVEAFLSGDDEDFILRLSQSVRRISTILSSAPLLPTRRPSGAKRHR